jgi:peptidoglycan-associated lipoprotein
LGVDAGNIRTISYGKDRPADPGHNDAAWAKNRRGEFVVLLPKPQS